jgi:hypothetical protein
MKVQQITTQDRRKHFVSDEIAETIKDKMERRELDVPVRINGNVYFVRNILSVTAEEIDSRKLDPETRARLGIKEAPVDSWMNLPTESTTLLADEDGKLERPSHWINERTTTEPYFLAKCHYRIEADGQKSYLLEIDKIPELALVKQDGDYAVVTGQWRYGRKIS